MTRAVLPVMRARRRGLIVTISSTGGIIGQAFVSAYSAAKFAVEGWMESLAPEIAPFGIRTMVVEPGFFRTELLTDESTKWPEASIADYAEESQRVAGAGQRQSNPVLIAGARRHDARLNGAERRSCFETVVVAEWLRNAR